MIEWFLLIAFLVMFPWIVQDSPFTIVAISVIGLFVVLSAKGLMAVVLCTLVLGLNGLFLRYYRT